ncbi:hypothetical protein NFA12_004314 [Salmonella enterica]|nr:hypothetical protein [Salmonella enterica]ELJ2376545.1 hypothetical protein [Salmonella enterica]
MNEVSCIQPEWTILEPNVAWVRQPPESTMTDPTNFPIYRSGMTFKHFIPAFNIWFAQGGRVANLVGIRADESAQQFSRHQLPAQAASVAGAAV